MRSSKVAAADNALVMPSGPSIFLRLMRTFSALPFRNSILGASVALIGLAAPSSSTTQSTVCGAALSLYSGAVKAPTSSARLMWSCTVQRASPKPHLVAWVSADLMVALAQVLVRLHLRY